MSMETAKSNQQNAQTHLSRLQQDEFRVKQVDDIHLHLVKGTVQHCQSRLKSCKQMTLK